MTKVDAVVTPQSIAEFDTGAFPRALAGLRDQTRSLRHRALLENLIAHAELENAGDLEGLTRLLSQTRQSYATFGPLSSQLVSSYEEAVAMYRLMIATGTTTHQYSADHITVLDHAIITAGTMHLLCPGELVREMWRVDVDDPTVAHQLSMRLALVFLFDEDGLSAGEHSYGAGAPIVTPIDGEPPAAFLQAAARHSSRPGEATPSSS
ncbi:hypothetical protein JF781_24185 [Mycobacterium sp. WUMAC-067]|uniref:hypothetical protein n=1 Tax=unclassified Mycobacterium TaxID=2642494 RepID=UPI001CD92D2B|nr:MULTISPECIES: hypothetical protein [unclassified Mycobacterium]MCA2245447.1 hypothetical protein [Mycobacterium sp. WUMAC-067]MCA2316995.1 hypothetical protein [Mycobacterium sp. WUMAC-025]